MVRVCVRCAIVVVCVGRAGERQGLCRNQMECAARAERRHFPNDKPEWRSVNGDALSFFFLRGVAEGRCASHHHSQTEGNQASLMTYTEKKKRTRQQNCGTQAGQNFFPLSRAHDTPKRVPTKKNVHPSPKKRKKKNSDKRNTARENTPETVNRGKQRENCSGHDSTSRLARPSLVSSTPRCTCAAVSAGGRS